MYLNSKQVSGKLPAGIRCPADDQLRTVGWFGNVELKAFLKLNTVKEVLLDLMRDSSVVPVPRTAVLRIQAKTLVWYLTNKAAE